MTKGQYDVLYSPVAVEDLKDVYLYVANTLKVPNVAKGQVRRIEQAIRKLSSFPSRHEAVDWEPWASMGIRRLKVDNFLVFYRVSEEKSTVEIVRVLYAGRNIEEIAKRDTRG